MQIIQSLPNKSNLFSLIFERFKFCNSAVWKKSQKLLLAKKRKRKNSKRLSENKIWIRENPSHWLVGTLKIWSRVQLASNHKYSHQMFHL